MVFAVDVESFHPHAKCSLIYLVKSGDFAIILFSPLSDSKRLWGLSEKLVR